ncbi:hypothetical protein ACHAW6_013215, partial [Cyclotella cf. meneghiniana]
IDIFHVAPLYNVGWSHGKERLSNQLNFAKTTLQPRTRSQRMWPLQAPCNIWPDATEMLLLANPQTRAKCSGNIMYKVIVSLTLNLDCLA